LKGGAREKGKDWMAAWRRGELPTELWWSVFLEGLRRVGKGGEGR